MEHQELVHNGTAVGTPDTPDSINQEVNDAIERVSSAFGELVEYYPREPQLPAQNKRVGKTLDMIAGCGLIVSTVMGVSLLIGGLLHFVDPLSGREISPEFLEVTSIIIQCGLFTPIPVMLTFGLDRWLSYEKLPQRNTFMKKLIAPFISKKRKKAMENYWKQCEIFQKEQLLFRKLVQKREKLHEDDINLINSSFKNKTMEISNEGEISFKEIQPVVKKEISANLSPKEKISQQIVLEMTSN